MKKTTLTRKLSALVFALLAGQVALASAAGAQGLLGFLVPPAPPAPAAAPAQAAAAPATPQQVEQKLAALKYDVGPADGNIDEQAASAVMAFQKVNNLPRTGELTPEVAARIMATQASPEPLVPSGEADRIEISLARQVLFLYQGGTLNRILPVSSGTSETPTPTGTFRIYRQDSGWHTSRLGRLHNAQYFIGGYAIHGSLSVPPEPASHGCVRIPMSASEWFPSHVNKGMQVVILES
ncbi:MAG: L,D-transpeptidase family protein [Actinomycetota bacterium]|nr:L,D-transpeptidase family protein [Actinomycetota bacterium]